MERNKRIWTLDLPKPNMDDFVQTEAGVKEPQPIWDTEAETVLDSEPEQNDEPHSASGAFLRQQKEMREPQTTGDRRQYRRYAVDGGAELRTKSSDTRTWGPLTDVSASGCYVEMYVPPPVGTELEMTLEVSDVRILADGIVKVIYPGLGIGIDYGRIPPAAQELLINE